MANGKDVGFVGRLERQVEGLSNRDRKLLLGLIAMLQRNYQNTSGLYRELHLPLSMLPQRR